MNTAFINVKCINLNSDDWKPYKRCYEVDDITFKTRCTSVHSIRTDEIVDVEHHACMLIVTSVVTQPYTLTYYCIKVRTPTGHGINEISSDIRVTEASYKRICSTLGITIDESID